MTTFFFSSLHILRHILSSTVKLAGTLNDHLRYRALRLTCETAAISKRHWALCIHLNSALAFHIRKKYLKTNSPSHSDTKLELQANKKNYRIPLSFALLSCRSMRLCSISKTSCLSSESSMSDGDSNGSRNGGGSALVIVIALYPEVTCSWLEGKLKCVTIAF